MCLPLPPSTLNPRLRLTLVVVMSLVTLTCVAVALTSVAPSARAAVSDCNGGTGGGVFSAGVGTARDPYQVTTSAQLAAIGTTDCLDEHFVQGADIALSGSWTPIGTAGSPFTGSFDGGGHVITGVAVAGTSGLGLFGSVSGSAISSLGLSGTVVASGAGAGLLTGYATATSISDVHTSGSVDADTGAGGLVGIATGATTVVASRNDATVAAQNQAGGLIGHVSADGLITIRRSINHATISAVIQGAGGLIGTSGPRVSATVDDSANQGPVITGLGMAGGVVGFGDTGTDLAIIDTSNIAPVTGDPGTSFNVGGFVGYANGPLAITNSANRAPIEGASYVGGFAGRLAGNLSIDDSINEAEITASANDGRAGGFVANMSSGVAHIAGSINSGDIDGDAFSGGFVGYLAGGGVVASSANSGAVLDRDGNGSYAGGMFGIVYGPTTISAGSNSGAVTGAAQVGGLVGYMNSVLVVDDSMNAGAVTGHPGAFGVGGLIGIANEAATIRRSDNRGVIEGIALVGGLIGWANAQVTVIDGLNTGPVRVTMNWGGGGIIGFSIGGSGIGVDMLRTDNRAPVEGVDSVGGLVGQLNNGTHSIDASRNSGQVSGAERVGGLIGLTGDTTTISASANHGSVTGTTSVGGIAGRSGGGLTLNDVYATGDVTATAGDAAGLIPYIVTGTISSSYASGEVTATGLGSALAGVVTGSTIDASFYDSSSTGTSNGPGTDTDLTRYATFAAAGWNIVEGWTSWSPGVSDWGICARANDARPFLLWEYDRDPCVIPPPPPPTSTTIRTTDPSDDPTAISALVDQASTVLIAAAGSPIDTVLAASGGGSVGGPVVVAHEATVPETSLREIDRWNPQRLVIVGGPRRLPSAIADALRARYPDADVQRVAGADRVATAVAVSRHFHPNGASQVLVVASDAPADAVAAAAQRRPLLLAEHDGVPEATLEEIERLGAEHIVVVGGSARIGPGVITTLADRFPSAVVERVGGADRYETAALLADDSMSEVLLVDGDLSEIEIFTAPAVAALSRRILLFGRPTCAPPATLELLMNRSAMRIGDLSLDRCG